MITLSLDEFGDFEGLQNKKEPVFIGGLLFDDADQRGEQYRERNRIRSYYQKVIEEAREGLQEGSPYADEFRYPSALHSNGNGARDHNVVRLVKERIRETLAEFLKYGTFGGRQLPYVRRNGETTDFWPRKGKYYVFLILKSASGMSELLSDHANILAKDNYGSNLYFHMADILITRLVFYNPLLRNANNFSFHIATRSSQDFKKDDPIVAQYESQGFLSEEEKERRLKLKLFPDDPDARSESEKKDDKVHFQLTNPDIYRTVIAEEILDAGRPDINISDFIVRSIAYYQEKKDMEFLYLADTICSFLQYSLPEGENEDGWLVCMKGRTKELIGEERSLVFGYDGIDSLFAKAWAKYEDGDHYEALSRAYDATKKKGAFAEHYSAVWFEKLKERILEADDVPAFNMAVRKLKETLNTNTLDQEKALWILEILTEKAQTIRTKFNTPEANRILYELYDCGMTSYCHVGNSAKAEEYFEKCGQYAGFVGLHEYLYTRNRMVVFRCDYFDLDRAEEAAEENVSYQELLTDMKSELRIPGSRESGYISMGIALSQRAQVYAFRRNENAEQGFREALEHFEQGSANYKITQSYLLHYYLDSGNRNAYLSEAKDYFGGETNLKRQFDYILREGAKPDPVINMKYAFYIFIRGLCLFRMNELSDRLWEAMQNTEKKFGEKIRKKEWQLSGHPSELIFKYLRLIAISRGDSAAEQKYKERMASCLRYYGPTEEVIRKFGETEIAEKMGDPEKRDVLSEELFRYLREHFPVFVKLETPPDGSVRYRWLDEHITFMYR